MKKELLGVDINQLSSIIYVLREKNMNYKRISEELLKYDYSIRPITVSALCKEIYAKLGKEPPKKRNKRRPNIVEISDEEIFDLRKQGLTYQAISNFYKERGIKISHQAIRDRCKRMYEEKEISPIKAKSKIVSQLPEEEIFELRQKKMTYTEISKHYESIGIKVSPAVISLICTEIYAKKGIEEPKIKKPRILKEVTDEDIMMLKDKGLSYKAIVDYYKEKGIEVSWATIFRRAKYIYGEEEKEIPDARSNQLIKNEDLINFRKMGWSYKQMAEYYQSIGVDTDEDKLCSKCYYLYEHKGFENPKPVRKPISEEEVYKMRKDGMKYSEMIEHYSAKGIEVEATTLSQRYNAYEKKLFAKTIFNLIKTRHATPEQLVTLAETYHVEKEFQALLNEYERE